jgi:hypothetical protein
MLSCIVYLEKHECINEYEYLCCLTIRFLDMPLVILGRVPTTTLQRATQRLLQPHFSNGMVAYLHYEHCGAV